MNPLINMFGGQCYELREPPLVAVPPQENPLYRYPEYRDYRAKMAHEMVAPLSYDDWLEQKEREEDQWD